MKSGRAAAGLTDPECAHEALPCNVPVRLTLKALYQMICAAWAHCPAKQRWKEKEEAVVKKMSLRVRVDCRKIKG